MSGRQSEYYNGCSWSVFTRNEDEPLAWVWYDKDTGAWHWGAWEADGNKGTLEDAKAAAEAHLRARLALAHGKGQL